MLEKQSLGLHPIILYLYNTAEDVCSNPYSAFLTDLWSMYVNLPSSPTRATNSVSLVSGTASFGSVCCENGCNLAMATKHWVVASSSTLSDIFSLFVNALRRLIKQYVMSTVLYTVVIQFYYFNKECYPSCYISIDKHSPKEVKLHTNEYGSYQGFF